MNRTIIEPKYPVGYPLLTPEVPGEKKTAVVFSGAGAKIILEAGMAKAMVDLGIKFDYAFGTSSGAIMAAAMMGDQIDDVINFMYRVKNKDVYTWAPWKLWTKEASLYDNAPLRKTLKSILNFDKIRANAANGKFFIANVCDLSQWSDQNLVVESHHTDEQIINTIVTSTAVPCLFPYQYNCVDGGIVDNYPLFDALAKHVDRVIMFVTSTKDPRPVNNVKDMFAQIFSLLMYNQFQVATRALTIFPTTTEVIIIQVEHNTAIPLLGFDDLGDRAKRQSYIDLGYRLAMDKLSKLKN